jgi:mannosyltransferase
VSVIAAREGAEAPERAQAGRRTLTDPATIAVGVLTVAAFVLRISQIHQSLYGDEVFTYLDIHGRGLSAVIATVNTGGENSPPLFFILAWAASKLGDPTVWLRLPSIIAGAAVVPVVYALARETFGRASGLIAAAIMALSPFTVYYGIEARPYALLMLCLALSTLALVYATRTNSRSWWAVFVVAGAAAAYTHYTGVFVLVVESLWALWVCRDRIRAPLISIGLIILLYIPWLPKLRGKELQVIGGLYPLTASHVIKDSVRIVVGSPLASLQQIPTTVGLILVAICVLAGLAAAVRAWRLAAPSSLRIDVSSPRVLMVALAVITPVGVLLYSLLSTDIWLPRGLSGSIPAIAVVIGALLAALPRRIPAVAAMVVVATLVVGTVKSFGTDYVRENYRTMASYLDREAAPHDPIVLASLLGGPAIQAEAHRPHPYLDYSVQVWRNLAAAMSRERLPAGTDVYVVLGDQEQAVLGIDIPHPPGFRLIRHVHFPGAKPTEILVYLRS